MTDAYDGHYSGLDIEATTPAPVTVVLDNDEADRDQWLAMRRRYLGGSDAAAYLGISPWTSPYSLYVDKTTEPDGDDGGSTRLRAGAFLEPFVASEARRQTPGLEVYRAPYMLASTASGREMLAVNLDGIAHLPSRFTPGIFEAKTSERFMEGDWADGPPAYYRAQLAHAGAVTGLRWALVAVMHGLGNVDVHVLDLDDLTVDSVADAGVAWWNRHVVAGLAPEVDGSASTTATLSEITPRPGHVVDLDATAEEETAELFRELARTKEFADTAKNRDAELRNQLRALIGDAEELTGPTGKWATYRRNKDSSTTDWQAIAWQLAADARRDINEVADLIETHTTTKPGNRTLRIDSGLRHITPDQKDQT